MEKVGRQLQLTPAGRLLTMFLQLYFTQYVDYGFTSDMEAQLDSVSGGSAVSPCPVWTFFLCRCCCSCSPDGPPSRRWHQYCVCMESLVCIKIGCRCFGNVRSAARLAYHMGRC